MCRDRKISRNLETSGTSSEVLAAREDRPNNFGWLGVLGILGLANLFRKGRTPSKL
jgi:hypothetical protein